MASSWVQAVAFAGSGAGGFGAAAYGLLRKLRQISRAFESALDDWRGTPERPGHPAMPGVLSRLDELERRVSTLEHRE